MTPMQAAERVPMQEVTSQGLAVAEAAQLVRVHTVLDTAVQSLSRLESASQDEAERRLALAREMLEATAAALRSDEAAAPSGGQDGVLLAALHAEINKRVQLEMEHAADIRRLRLQLARAEQQNLNIRNTFAFRIGYTLLNAGSWRGLVKLPGKFWALYKESVERRKRRAGPAPAGAGELPAVDTQVAAALEQYAIGGLPAVLLSVETTKGLGRSARARLLVNIAREIFNREADDGLALAKAAYDIDPKPYIAKWIAFRAYDVGAIAEPLTWLERIPEKTAQEFKAPEEARRNEIEGAYRLLTEGLAIPRRDRVTSSFTERRIAYVASSVQPFHISGYTSRTASILRAVVDRGIDATVFAKPGYPVDRSDVTVKMTSETYEDDGVRYQLTPVGVSRQMPLDQQIARAADLLTVRFRDFRPSVVHAATDFRNALPALIAARRLGLPFIYEVRGLWEFTTASKKVNWEGTERFALTARLEALCAANADLVFTLTPFLRDELVKRGVAADRIGLAPNCVDLARFAPAPVDREGRLRLGLPADSLVVGYAGSFVEYEGLDDLIMAASQLKTALPHLRLLLVGDGAVKPRLQRLVADQGLTRRVVFTGRVQPKEVGGFIAMMDAYAVPRRPERVCHLVSPLKPLEAMAMAKPVIVSDVGGMAGMVVDGHTGYVHKAGDAASLAQKIRELSAGTDHARTIGEAAHAFVERERTWSVVAATFEEAYRQVAPELATA